VDDNPQMMFQFKGLPLNFKCKREFSSNGRDAIKKYVNMIEKNKVYHIIFLDIMMPSFNGLETATEIRAI